MRLIDKLLKVHGVILTLGCLASGVAQAQSIDYGGLQELFGEPVTTSATGKPQKSSEAPVALEIVGADQIRRMGVFSLPEVLNRVSGLTSWQSTRSWSDVGIRGQNAMYNPTLLVLLNGRQVYIDSYGFADWSLIPVQLEEIRQIEIVKGPATALYGFNAVSGVVNIVTYNPKYDDVGQAGVTVGSGDYRRAYAFKTLQLSPDTSIRLSGGKQAFDEFDRESKTNFASQGQFQDGSNGKFLADSVTQLTDNTQLRIEGSYSASDTSDPPTSPSAIPADKKMSSAKATLVSETDLGLIRSSLYTNIFEGDFGGSTAGKIKNQIIVGQVEDLFKVGAEHTFRLQSEYRHNRVHSDTFAGPGVEISYDVLAAGGMWNWAITPEIEWTNALRVDHLMLDRNGAFATTVPFTSNSEFDRDLTDVGGNSGIVWKATELDTLRASFGRGIQAPSLLGFGIDVNAAPGVVYVGNPDMDTMIVNNYEVGYDRSLSIINGKFRSSLFYKESKGIETLAGTSYLAGSSFVIQAATIGDSKTAGMEMGLSGKINSQWNWDTSYIYQNSVDDFTAHASTMPTSVTLHYENTIPHHVFKAHLGYTTGQWEADVYGEAASNFDAVSPNNGTFNKVKLDGYYTLGGRVGYTFEPDITVALSGSELAQARVTNNYGLENERRVYLTVSKKF